MPAYIANHEKKKRILAKRERELIHAIKHDLPIERISFAAERIREAKMNVFKCDFSKSTEVQPHNFSPEEMAASNELVREWLHASTDDIIDAYRPQ
jgi:hypothetical protein